MPVIPNTPSKPEDSIDGVCHCPSIKKGEKDGDTHVVCNGKIEVKK